MFWCSNDAWETAAWLIGLANLYAGIAQWAADHEQATMTAVYLSRFRMTYALATRYVVQIGFDVYSQLDTFGLPSKWRILAALRRL